MILLLIDVLEVLLAGGLLGGVARRLSGTRNRATDSEEMKPSSAMTSIAYATDVSMDQAMYAASMPCDMAIMDSRDTSRSIEFGPASRRPSAVSAAMK